MPQNALNCPECTHLHPIERIAVVHDTGPTMREVTAALKRVFPTAMQFHPWFFTRAAGLFGTQVLRVMEQVPW